MTTETESDFRNAIAEHGPAPAEIVADGNVHRYDIDEPGDKAGWYLLHGDGVPAGVFGNWKTGVSTTWCAKQSHEMTEAEQAENRWRIEDARLQREEEKAKSQARARTKAVDMLAMAGPAPADHPYLVMKGVAPAGLKVLNGNILVPVVDDTGAVCSLQTMSPDGQKLFLTGGRIKGCSYTIPGNGDLYIGEGFATMASIHAATGGTCICAFNAGNLESVVKTVREKNPTAPITICGDDDRWTNGNPGRTKATAAAEKYRCRVVFPEFNSLDAKPTDFNDLAMEKGLQKVKRQIEAAGPAENVWPDPMPLPDGLPPVASFAFELLPETLRPWASDIVERMQCPPDFVAAAIMAALACIIGRKIGIRPQLATDWTVVVNQWAMLIGRPGVLKSPAMEAALAPVKRLAAMALERYQNEAVEYERTKIAEKLRAEAAEKAARAALKKNPDADLSHILGFEKSEAPTMARYMANDTTAAALGELHRQNPNGLLVFRDELVSLLKMLDREENAEARGFYLTGWNGDSAYTFDRITRGMNLHIPAVCISLLGSTQPARIAQYVKAVVNGIGDDGLLQRFGMTVWPDTGGKWKDVDRWPDSEAKNAAFKVFDRLSRMDPFTIGAHQDNGPDGAPDGIPFLRFDEAGLSLFRDWRHDLETRLRSGDMHPALESHLSKYRKLVPGIALICHLADGHNGPVGRPKVLQALAWAEYLETHARRLYASVEAPGTVTARAIIAKIRKGALPTLLTVREVYRRKWSGLTDLETIKSGLKVLVDHDWMLETQKNTGGRPTIEYQLNPRTEGLK
ncbi:DUF3987 domain-containing protein [Desulfosarcina ovata]|uniref:Toprim domain-containing protein n=1 Tax=Desulfosarcina ovata subsp. ovata TaxID=2752305 RepID=A0A5K8A6M8_9BACT|nr:DUF3987 domain-containing protein [Desulfosarcina ovata]BBO88185.1 hypothetical protein DSCOOX_13650 [Desulfosarcina ovata subsp. ovata]